MDKLDEILQTLQSIEALAHEILTAETVSGAQVIVIGGMSDISDNLGLVKAGEFRSGRGTPGIDFTGVRMGSPGWTYGGTQYSIVGLSNETLEFGLCNTDGKFYAGGGDLIIDNGGVFLYDTDGGGTPFVQFVYESGGSNYTIGELAGQGSAGLASISITTYLTDTSPWTDSMVWLCANDTTTTPDTISQIQIDTNHVILIDAATIRLKSTNLSRYIGTTDYLGVLYIPLDTPLTSTSWDGDSYSSTANYTQLDLSAVFSAPANLKAVKLETIIRDSGSAANDVYIAFGNSGTPTHGIAVRSSGLANDAYHNMIFDVPCDANGDVFYKINASGASTMDVYIKIWGYYL